MLAIVGDRIDRLALPLHTRGARRPSARLGALGRIRRAPPAAVRAGRDRRAGGARAAGARTSTSASRTTARCREHRRAARLRRDDGRLRRGHQRPAADQRRHVQAAGQGRPVQPRQDQPAGAGPEGQGQPAGRRAGAADRRAARGAGRAAGAGPVTGAGAGRSRSSTSSSSRSTDQSDDQRKKAEQPATDPRLQDLRDDDRQDQRRQVGHGAAGQQRRHRGGAQRHADDRPLRPGDRATSSTACATTRSRRPRRATT